jgi:membrane protein DedA with SNARE-associated domain
MEEFTSFVVAHGYLLLAGWVCLDQLGIPIPAIPVLIAGGAVASTGELDLVAALIAASAGSLLSDLIWFEAGRRRGTIVLRVLCKVSLEPDSCVRNTQEIFARYGTRSLLFAKFIPGYQTMAPPLAGMSGMSLIRFLAFDLPGAVLWSGSFMAVGFLFSDQLDSAYRVVSEFGSLTLLILVGGLVAYVAWRFYHRRRYIRHLRMQRIEPDALMALLAEDPDVALFDLRSAMEIEMEPRRIQGAQVLSFDELDDRHEEIPRDREIILYCT